MKANRTTVQATAAGFATIALAALLFWLLPILVWRNSFGAAERMSKLPGVSPTGGYKAGISMTVYLTFSLVTISSLAVAVGVGAPDSISAFDLSGDDGGPTTPEEDTPTPEPTETGTPTPESTPTPEPTATPTPENESESGNPNVAPDVSNPTGATLRTYAHNESWVLTEGQIRVYDDEGLRVERITFSDSSVHALQGLEPGTNYTVLLDETPWVDMEPTVTFDPGQTDEVKIFQLPHFHSTEKFKWRAKFAHGGYMNEEFEVIDKSKLVNKEEQGVWNGTYDNGNFDMVLEQLWIYRNDGFDENQYISFNDNLFLNGWNGSTVEYNNEIAFTPTEMPSFKVVRQNLVTTSNLNIEYIETRELNSSLTPDYLQIQNWSIPEATNGSEVHVFDVQMAGNSEWAGGSYTINEDHDARIYVDTETGDILRWVAKVRLTNGAGTFDFNTPLTKSHIIIDFYNHGNESIDLDPNDYPKIPVGVMDKQPRPQDTQVGSLVVGVTRPTVKE